MSKFQQACCWKMLSVSIFVIVSMGVRILTSHQFTNNPIPISEILFLESIVILAAFIFLSIFKNQNLFLNFRINKLTIQRTIFSVLGIYFYYLTLKNIKFLESIAMNLLTPILGLVFARVIFKEKLNKLQYVAIILAFIGVTIIIWNEFMRLHMMQLSTAIAYPILAAICLTASKLLTRKLVSLGYAPLYSVLQFMFGIAAATAPFCYFNFVMPEQQQWICIVLLSVLNLIAHFSFAYAYKFSGISLLTPVSLIKLIFAAIGSYLLLGELPSNIAMFLVGAIMLLTSIFLSMKKF